MLILSVVAILVAVAVIFFSPKWRTNKKMVEVFLRSFLFFVYGIGGLMGFICFILFPTKIAEHFGLRGSHFEFEIGVANLGFGALGVLTAYFREKFWVATVIFSTIWMWGFGVGNIVSHLNYAALYSTCDFIIPVVVLALFFAYMKMNKISFR